MLRADENTRRRITALFLVLGLFLGGTMIAGMVERLGLLHQDDAPPNAAQIKAEHDRIVQMARERRAFSKQMGTLGRANRWNEVISEASARLAAHNGDMFTLALRAEALFWTGKRAAAAADFSHVLPLTDSVVQADLLVLKGDKEGYRHLCEETLAKTDIDHSLPLASNNAAWVAALAPQGLSDYVSALALAERGVSGALPEERPTYLNTLGGVLYRAGRDADAITRLTETETMQSDPFNWAFLALAHHRLGHTTEASKWRDRLRRRLEETFATQQQQPSRHELLFLWAEVAQTVGPGEKAVTEDSSAEPNPPLPNH